MKAIELKEKYLKKTAQNKVGVIAIDKGFWFHVHDDEEIPLENTYHSPPTKYDIALHLR